VGNNEYGMRLATLGKRDRLDSGQLWLFVAKQRSAAALLWFAVRAALGRVDGTRYFEALRGRSVEITMQASRVPVALDGEVVTMRPPLRYRVRPGALRVLAPTPVPA
jgi:diacylglycerol kinase family enzyme